MYSILTTPQRFDLIRCVTAFFKRDTAVGDDSLKADFDKVMSVICSDKNTATHLPAAEKMLQLFIKKHGYKKAGVEIQNLALTLQMMGRLLYSRTIL